jgi:hypothetical protein
MPCPTMRTPLRVGAYDIIAYETMFSPWPGEGLTLK